MAEKPQLLVIDRNGMGESQQLGLLAEGFELVRTHSISRAISLLRTQDFAGVFVARSQIPSVRFAGGFMQAEEVLEAIADGIALVDAEKIITWCNPQFTRFCDPNVAPAGAKFYNALGSPEILEDGPCAFQQSRDIQTSTTNTLRINANRYLRIIFTPIFDAQKNFVHWITLARDITAETLHEQKIKAIHQAGEELADISPEDLLSMGVQDRTDLLKHNIIRHMKDLLGLDYFEIRMLEQQTGRLLPLLAEGMTEMATERELLARKEGHGVTGRVAATGQSYLVTDTIQDPLYLEGAAGARSSLTVPLIDHGRVIGTLNVESNSANAFDDVDRQILEIYARNIAESLHTLELLHAEKLSTTVESVEMIRRELALPLDEILNNATTALDRYAGHDEEIVNRLRHVMVRAREIRGLIERLGTSMMETVGGGNVPDPLRKVAGQARKFLGHTLLVADAETSVRRTVHQILGQLGAIVETAGDAHEAIALARQTPYSLALVDIRLPDLNGYDTYKRLKAVQPDLPIILVTGFGYDPTHSIVNARQDGLKFVLYKPFRPDRLIEVVEQSLAPTENAE